MPVKTAARKRAIMKPRIMWKKMTDTANVSSNTTVFRTRSGLSKKPLIDFTYSNASVALDIRDASDIIKDLQSRKPSANSTDLREEPICLWKQSWYTVQVGGKPMERVIMIRIVQLSRLSIVLLCFLGSGNNVLGSELPNIVLILADDLGGPAKGQ